MFYPEHAEWSEIESHNINKQYNNKMMFCAPWLVWSTISHDKPEVPFPLLNIKYLFMWWIHSAFTGTNFISPL